jgi:MFS family permease
MRRLGIRILAPTGLLAAICFQLSAPTFFHPAPGESLDKYAEAFLDQRGAIATGAFFALIGGMLLVSFLGALAGSYRKDERQRPLLWILFGSGLVAAALFVLGRAVLPLLAIQLALFEEPAVVAAVEETVWIVEVFVVPFFVISMLGATAYVVPHSPGLAKWIRWPAVAVGLLAGLMFVLMVIGIAISPETFGDYQGNDKVQTFQPGGLAGGVIGPIALLLWSAVGAAAMIQGSRREASSPATKLVGAA